MDNVTESILSVGAGGVGVLSAAAMLALKIADALTKSQEMRTPDNRESLRRLARKQQRHRRMTR